jgi:hypothetical protein
MTAQEAIIEIVRALAWPMALVACIYIATRKTKPKVRRREDD